MPAGTLEMDLVMEVVENGVWKTIEGSRADFSTGTITAEVTHFSPYAGVRRAAALEINPAGDTLTVGQTNARVA